MTRQQITLKNVMREAFMAGVAAAHGTGNWDGPFADWWENDGEDLARDEDDSTEAWYERGRSIALDKEVAEHLRSIDAKAVLQTHDEVQFEVPKPIRMFDNRAAYRCDHYACPERAAVRADAAPTCYTCGRPMSVAAVAGDLIADRDGDLQIETGIESVIDDITVMPSDLVAPHGGIEKLTNSVAMTLPKGFPKWETRRDTRVRDEHWGPSPIRALLDARASTLPRLPGESDADLRFRRRLEFAAGEELDEIGREVGLVREPRTANVDAEPDVELRERIRMCRSQYVQTARHAVGMHLDVRGVHAEVRKNARGEPMIYVQATLYPDKMTDALVRELDDRLRAALPVWLDYRLDCVYSER